MRDIAEFFGAMFGWVLLGALGLIMFGLLYLAVETLIDLLVLAGLGA